MMFRDRADAGRHLARLLRAQLPALRGQLPLVLATFPAGVAIGRAIADGLGAPLDVIVTRRLDAPGGADVGIGAVASGGARLLDHLAIRMLGVSDAYVDEVSRAETEAAELEMAGLRAIRDEEPVRARTVVIADDGADTRWRARVAIQALRERGAASIIVAVPVLTSDVRDLLAREADAVLCGMVPERYVGAAAHFGDFAHPSADAVRRMLAAADSRSAPARAPAPLADAKPVAARADAASPVPEAVVSRALLGDGFLARDGATPLTR